MSDPSVKSCGCPYCPLEEYFKNSNEKHISYYFIAKFNKDDYDLRVGHKLNTINDPNMIKNLVKVFTDVAYKNNLRKMKPDSNICGNAGDIEINLECIVNNPKDKKEKLMKLCVSI